MIEPIVFKTSEVFGILENAEIKTLSQFFEKHDVNPGDIIASACESAFSFFIIAKGTFLLGMDKDRSVILNRSGDFIAMELLSFKGKYKTTVTSLEKGQVYAISREDFLNIIQQDIQVAEKIMDAWQDYLDQTAPFAKKIDNTDLCECF